MTSERIKLQQNNPLHGLKQEAMLTELLEHYGWEILAAQLNLNSFKSHPSLQSSLKFLRNTEWARLRLEAFYLYKFKNLPLPSDEQHKLPPRERLIDAADLGKEPASISLDDREFFDDPISGPVFKQTRHRRESRKKANDRPKSRREPQRKHKENPQTFSADTADGAASPDPWAKWR